MQNFMTSVAVPDIANNIFDLSHDVRGSMKIGVLYPALCMEVLPGESFTCSCDHLIRFNPMVFPVMHRFRVKKEWFFVPNRIVWSKWRDFISNYVTPPGASPVHPFITCKGVVDGTTQSHTDLLDWLGVPLRDAGAAGTEDINALPVQGYNIIWDEYYRQDFIINRYEYILVDGDNTANVDISGGYNSSLLQTRCKRRAWQHDYFTSCLPTPQHGTAIPMPVSFADVPVRVSKAGPGNAQWTNTGVGAGNILAAEFTSGSALVSADHAYVAGGLLAQANASTIADLRMANAIQTFFERIMRTGRRYVEVIKAAFGTDGGDARLSRPEYIYGTSSAIVISEVLNTSDTATAPQGNMAGHGIGVAGDESATYFCKEHGFIFCMVSVIPDTAYYHGIPAYLTKKTHYTDYFWREFANLTEQAILTREVFAYTGSSANVFGYLPMYSRYRTINPRVVGQMRSTLENFHMGRKFTVAGGIPTLSQSFIECTRDKRIFAVTDPNVDELTCHFNFDIFAKRQVPKFGTPSLG